MWISKKKFNDKLYLKEYNARQEEWRLRDEHNQNIRISELDKRVTSLEIKAGLKSEPKSCCCGPEEVAIG
jgi:hypothetical protein